MNSTHALPASSGHTRRSALDFVLWWLSMGLILTAVALAF
jgi:hypothetical protein